MSQEKQFLGYSAWGISNLFFIYIVWSSTYLAMAYMVNPIGGFPPFLAGTIRLVGGGIILLVLAAFRKTKLLPSWSILGKIALSALLLWVMGNSLMLFALHRNLDSGVAAVIIGTTPIWSITVDALTTGRRLGNRIILALVAGTAGIIVLNIPNFRGNIDILAVIAVVVSAMAWGSGTVYQSRQLRFVNIAVLAGWQQIFGAVGYYLLSTLFMEQLQPVNANAIFGLIYLIVVASVIAMMSFIIAVNKLPIAVVMSYAYVNPVLALVLGHFFNNETISGYTILGTIIIACGVVAIFWKKTAK